MDRAPIAETNSVRQQSHPPSSSHSKHNSMGERDELSGEEGDFVPPLDLSYAKSFRAKNAATSSNQSSSVYKRAVSLGEIGGKVDGPNTATLDEASFGTNKPSSSSYSSVPLITPRGSFVVRSSIFDKSSENIPPVSLRLKSNRKVHPLIGKTTLQGDYLQLESNPNVLDILATYGDSEVLFADSIARLKKSNAVERCLLIITRTSIYIVQSEIFSLQHRILLRNVESLYLSEMEDNFLAVMVPEEFDHMMVSTRKQEIVTVLLDAVEKKCGRELTVNFGNRFSFNVDARSRKQVVFEEAKGCIRTRIIDI